jgi:hypothetical protein
MATPDQIPTDLTIDLGDDLAPDSKACPDPNCDGHLVIEEDRVYGQVWRCNGLTHEGPDGPLVACNHSHLDGPCRQ